MRKYEDFIDGLQKDIEVPSDVSLGFSKALNNLPDAPKSKRKMRKWIMAFASTAAVLAIGTGVLIANPVLAAKIPIIGKIFERVEDRVTYSGDFKDKADVLTVEPEATQVVDVITSSEDEGDAAKTEEAVETVDTTYSVEDQGVTFTASEVYCDGHSLYLTAKIESKDGGFNDMTGYSTVEDPDNIYVRRMYAWGGGVTDQGIIGENGQQGMEGDVIDDNTFVGMLKLDLEQAVSGTGVFNLDLTMLGFDGKQALMEESNDIDVTDRYDGNWKLAIPYTVDTEVAKTIDLNKEAVDGFKVNKIFVSPYQVIVYLNAPYTEVTAENFDEVYSEFNEALVESGQEAMEFEDDVAEGELKKQEMIAAGAEPAEIEEAFSNRYYNEFDLALFNQDDEVLEWWGATLVDDQWVAKFAVKGIDIAKLKLFLSDKSITLAKAQNINEAKEIAVWNTDINVE
jgi:hypothetical protein